MDGSQPAVIVFCLLMIIAGAGDAMMMRIPNRLTILISALFLPAALASGMAPADIWVHFASGLALLVPGYLLFRFGYIGGGDAKLIAAAGLWLGFPCSAIFLVLTGLSGGVLALAMSVWFVFNVEAGLRSDRLGRLFLAFSPDIPYGFAIAAGAILATPYSWFST